MNFITDFLIEPYESEIFRLPYACKLRANEKGSQALSPETLVCVAPPAGLEPATL